MSNNSDNNNDENERKLQNKIRAHHKEREARLRRSNYYSTDTSNIVLVTGIEEMEKIFNEPIFVSDLKRHFEREDPTRCYTITQITRINGDNVLISFADVETARSAVLEATQIYIMGKRGELDLRLIKRNNSNTSISNRPVSKHVKRADIIDAMAQAPQ